MGKAHIGPIGIVKIRLDGAAKIRSGIVGYGLTFKFPLAVKMDLLPACLYRLVGVADIDAHRPGGCLQKVRRLFCTGHPVDGKHTHQKGQDKCYG